MKLEHRRSFLEFCRYHNVTPFGLRLKKTCSDPGPKDGQFMDSWENTLRAAERQLVCLMLLKYRDDIESAKMKAYEQIKDLRQNLTKEEMGHIKEQLGEEHEILRRRREKKATNSNAEGWRWLSNKNHIEYSRKKRALSEVEISLLSKGLKFSPTPTDLNRAQLKADLGIFRGECDFDGFSVTQTQILRTLIFLNSNVSPAGILLVLILC